MHGFANPARFLRLARWLTPALLLSGLVLTAASLTYGMFFAPAERLQGETVRILFIHVPTAWLGMGGWTAIAIAIVLLVLNGGFVAAEIALLAARRTRVEEAADAGDILPGQHPSTRAQRSQMSRYALVVLSLILFFLAAFLVAAALDVPLLTGTEWIQEHAWASAVAILNGLLIGDVLLPIPSSLLMVANGALLGTVVGAQAGGRIGEQRDARNAEARRFLRPVHDPVRRPARDPRQACDGFFRPFAFGDE